MVGNAISMHFAKGICSSHLRQANRIRWGILLNMVMNDPTASTQAQLRSGCMTAASPFPPTSPSDVFLRIQVNPCN